MGRLNIEDRCFGETRLRYLAKSMGWSNLTALGALAFVWHESQSMDLVEVTEFQLSLWTELEGEQFTKFVALCCELKYFTRAENKFYIHGNRDQLSAIREHKSRMKKARKNRWQNEKRPQKPASKCSADQQCTDQYTDQSTDQCTEQCTDQCKSQCTVHNSIQFNSIQFKSNQLKSSQRDLSGGVAPPAKGGPTLGSRIWQVYETEYQKKYLGQKPFRNATTNAQCQQLGKRLGEEALEVVKFYLRHPGQKYANAMHTLGFLLADAEGIGAQWRTKTIAPTGFSHAQSVSDHNRALLEKIDRGEA